MIYRPEISLCAGLVAMVGGISEMVHVLKMLYWGLSFLSFVKSSNRILDKL